MSRHSKRQTLRASRFLACPIVFFVLAVCAAAASGKRPAVGDQEVVIIPVANMYSSATENTDVVSQAILGSDVVVLEVNKKWAKVRTSDQYTGWMPISALRKLTGANPYASQGHSVEVESLFANLYRERDVTQHPPLLTVPFEARLELLSDGAGDQGRWLPVILPDGRSAWIQRGDINPDAH